MATEACDHKYQWSYSIGAVHLQAPIVGSATPFHLPRTSRKPTALHSFKGGFEYQFRASVESTRTCHEGSFSVGGYKGNYEWP